MNRNNFWRSVLVILVLAWSAYEMYPPTPRDLLQHFRDRAVNRDTNFTAIVQKAQALNQQMPEKAYDNLKTAIGDTDLSRYFPFFDTKDHQDKATAYVLNRLQRESAGRIRLGLDLQGGTSVLVKMRTSALTNVADANSAISQAVEVLRKRVDRFGVAEPVIQLQGNDAILVQLPGLSASDQEAAIAGIKKAAFLEFKLVHEKSQELIQQGITEPGYVVMTHVRTLPNGTKQTDRYLVKRRAEMQGGIKSAMVTRNNMGQPEIAFTLDATAAEKFGRITRDNVGRLLAIILDGELQTAPVIRTAIEGGSGVIQGDYSQQEAFMLQNVLENPLKAPLDVEASSQVSPTLGKDSIRSGVQAAIYGTVAVAVFMLVYYMFAGLVANVALMANIVILLGVMCSVGTTLTLPGIAGIVLTIGMAVDANVLIYERIREESAKGKSLRGAIDAGYDKAFGTIFDSNLTTLISSVILIFLGTGSVKGFGVALTIGVTASMFTALIVTRLIFDFMLSRGLLKSLPMLHIIRANKIDFMALAKPAFMTSWLLIVIGIGYGFYRGSSVFGIDFRGGETVTFEYAKQVDEKEIRAALSEAKIKDPRIQYQKDLVTGKQTLRIDSLPDPNNKVTVKDVIEKLPAGQFKQIGQQTVGAAVGRDVQRSAIISTLLALFGILVYVAFRYEFSFAVGAVIAIIHDILMTIGWYCLSGRQFDGTTVAALLTIIGFSINDTIVIFDRIREDLKLGVRGSFKEVMNQALNQTLSRTIITSGTVFLATLSLYLFGGGDINAFAFCFLVGILTGTYSSIYIASALVLWWHKGQRPHLGSGPIESQAAAAPARS